MKNVSIEQCMRIYAQCKNKPVGKEMYREHGRIFWDMTLPKRDLEKPRTIKVDVIGEEVEFIIGGDADEEGV